MEVAKRHISLIVLALVLLTNTVAKAQHEEYYTDEQLDSLALLSASMPDDTNRLKILNNISAYHYNVDSTEKYANQLLELATKLDDKQGIAQSYRYLAWSSFYRNDYVTSREYHYSAIIIWTEFNDEKNLSYHYLELGINYAMLGQFKQADKFFGMALKYYANNNDYEYMSEVYRNMGYMCIVHKMFETANDYIDQALKYDMIRCDTMSIGEDYYYKATSMVDYHTYNPKTDALNYAIKLCRIALGYQQENTRAYLWTNRLLYTAYYTKLCETVDENQIKQLSDSCLFFRKECLKTIKRCGFVDSYLDIKSIDAKYFIKVGNFEMAQKYLAEMKEYLDENKNLESEYLEDIYVGYKLYYEAIGDYKKALEYERKIDEFVVSQKSNEFAMQLGQTNAQTKYEEIMRQKEQEERENNIRYEEQIKRRNVAISLALICFLLMSALTINIFRNLVSHRRTNKLLLEQQNLILEKNEELNQQTEEISAQRDEIETQRNDLERVNERMTESIQYAKRIQTATVPNQEMLSQMFGEMLVYWKPLDIVSGDFYWATQKDQFRVLAVADCTGHGVPGAFMSILGISSLNDIVLANDISKVKASEILDQMKGRLINALHQKTGLHETQDGIDISLCIFNYEKMTAQYAGAYRPLIIMRDGEMIEYKGDKMPVGYHAIKSDQVFINNEFSLVKGDTIYMYTDGLPDQFGIDETGNKSKFCKVRFAQMIKDVYLKPFSEQKKEVEKRLSEWTRNGQIEQIDDQLLIGIKI